jgi:hypothetical protein
VIPQSGKYQLLLGGVNSSGLWRIFISCICGLGLSLEVRRSYSGIFINRTIFPTSCFSENFVSNCNTKKFIYDLLQRMCWNNPHSLQNGIVCFLASVAVAGGGTHLPTMNPEPSMWKPVSAAVPFHFETFRLEQFISSSMERSNFPLVVAILQ